jgi:3-methyladenine DNA glycosylase AlkD
MLKWSQDPDFWVRRVAIEFQLLRKGETDTALLAQIIENNLGSQEFFINKAIGWALRDYSKTNPAWVADFINRHQEDLSKLSIREGSKYLKN